jgi:P27 family predicted phage terminase small subunit
LRVSIFRIAQKTKTQDKEIEMPMLKPIELPKPPKHLRAATRKWFSAVVADYAMEAHHVRILTLACESWDRAAQAREALAEHGLVFTDRYGCPHPRPEAAIERNSMVTYLRAVRELGLEVEQPTETPRPPALRNGRRN